MEYDYNFFFPIHIIGIFTCLVWCIPSFEYILLFLDVYSRRSPYVRRRQQNYQNEDIIDLDSELLMQGADDILPHVTRNNSTIDLDSASDDDLPNPPFEIQDARYFDL